MPITTFEHQLVYSQDSYLPPSHPSRGELQEFIYEYAEQKNLRLCNHGYRFQGAEGTIRAACRNRLACPSCSKYLLAKDAVEISKVLKSVPVTAFFTLSVGSNKELRIGLDELEKVRRAVFSTGSWFSDFKSRNDIRDYVISLEFTVGEEGWHPHLHVATTGGENTTSDALGELQRHWLAAASRLRVAASPAAQTGSLVPPADRGRIAGYLTKQHARRLAGKYESGRYPGDLLEGAARGDADDMALLMEFHAATHGRHKLTTSRGFGS